MKISDEELRQAFQEIVDDDLKRIQDTYGQDAELNRQIELSMRKMDWKEIYRKAQAETRSKAQRAHRFGKWRRIAAAVLVFLVAGSVTAGAVAVLHSVGVQWNKTLGNQEDTFAFTESNPVETVQADSTAKAFRCRFILADSLWICCYSIILYQRCQHLYNSFFPSA